MMLIAAALAALLGSTTAAPPSTPRTPPTLLEEVIKAHSPELRTAMQIYAIPAAAPGRTIADLPGHRHPGHVYVYVLEGQVRSKLDDGPDNLFSAGQAWSEQPGQLHRILNPVPGTVARLLVVTIDPHN